MSGPFESSFISLSDDNGNNFELEHLDTIMMDDEYYLACLPTDIKEDDPDYGIVILKQEEDDNGELYLVIPDDDEGDRAYDEYMRRLFEEWDDDDGEEE